MSADLGTNVVGRERELALMTAVLYGGGDLVLEGPPGTSKTTLLRATPGAQRWRGRRHRRKKRCFSTCHFRTKAS